jgi:HSP20 family protein
MHMMGGMGGGCAKRVDDLVDERFVAWKAMKLKWRAEREAACKGKEGGAAAAASAPATAAASTDDKDKKCEKKCEKKCGGRRGRPLRINVHETAAAFIVSTGLAGVPRANIAVTVEDGAVLCIAAERKRDETIAKSEYRRVERRSGTFARRLRLPRGVVASGITARYADGLLTLSIPKSAAAPPAVAVATVAIA